MIPMKDSSRTFVKIFVNELGEAKGELIRFLAPRTVEAILRKLPVEGRAALLKGGFYFEVPLKMGLEKATKNVSAGTMAFWPLGSALCFFFENSRPYSSVNIVGRVTENVEVLGKAKIGTRIRVEKV